MLPRLLALEEPVDGGVQPSSRLRKLRGQGTEGLDLESTPELGQLPEQLTHVRDVRENGIGVLVRLPHDALGFVAAEEPVVLQHPRFILGEFESLSCEPFEIGKITGRDLGECRRDLYLLHEILLIRVRESVPATLLVEGVAGQDHRSVLDGLSADLAAWGNI